MTHTSVAYLSSAGQEHLGTFMSVCYVRTLTCGVRFLRFPPLLRNRNWWDCKPRWPGYSGGAAFGEGGFPSLVSDLQVFMCKATAYVNE